MIANRTKSRGLRRAGFGLIELALTGVLIAAAMAATVQVVGWVALERRAVERRQRALAEASNLLERIGSRPWDELTPEALGKVRMSESSAEFLPGSTLDLKVTSHDDAPARKKIVLEIRWRERSGRTESPVRLVSWTYRRGEAPR